MKTFGNVIHLSIINWHAVIWMSTTAIFSIFAGSFATDSAAYQPIAQRNIVLTEIDSGSTIEISLGTNVNVFLRVPPLEIYKHACLWSEIVMTNDSIMQHLNVHVLLPTGVTGGLFRAIGHGTVQLKSSRHKCSNGVNLEWYVNVRVN
jgi:hypothetical protein